MHQLEKAIITVFSEQPSAVLSTSELVDYVMPEQVSRLEGLDALVVKRERARLHRKLLYHLQKLVGVGALEVVGIQGRGEKRFSLVSGEVTIRHKETQVTINNPVSLETPIDSLSGVQGIMRDSWLSKVNALLLESASFSDLYEAAQGLSDSSRFVNDVIGLLRFDLLLGTGDAEEFLDCLRKLSCKVSLIISLSQMADSRKVVRFCRSYAMHRPSNVQIIFTASARSLNNHQETLCQVIELFMKRTIKINLKNNNVHSPPIICGSAGAYTIDNDDWLEYKKNRRFGLVLCGASAVVDLEQGHAHKLGREAARSLFLVERARYSALESLQKKDICTSYLVDVVRFWNFDLYSDTLLEELSSTREVIKNFCVLQERIYRACGLPVRSRIRISSSFAKASALSNRSYKKVRVHNISSLQDESYSLVLRRREALCKLFSGDRIRVFRHGRDDAIDVFREIALILNSYALPYLTYDFSELKGDVKLTEFLGDTL